MGCQHVEGHDVVIMSSCGVIIVMGYIFLKFLLIICINFLVSFGLDGYG